MTDKRINSPLADDDGDAIKRITPARFAELDKSTVTLLDLREPDEVLVHGLDGAINIPFNQIGTRLSQVPNDKPVVVFCRVGDWSEQVTEILADRGYDAINLDGGFQAYREYLASLPQQRENDVDDGDARPEKQARGSAATLSIPAAAQQISLRGPEHESKSTGGRRLGRLARQQWRYGRRAASRGIRRRQRAQVPRSDREDRRHAAPAADRNPTDRRGDRRRLPVRYRGVVRTHRQPSRLARTRRKRRDSCRHRQDRAHASPRRSRRRTAADRLQPGWRRRPP